MATEIELDTEYDELIVKDRDGEIHPIPVPSGFSGAAFRDAVATVYTLFIQTGKIPSVTECNKLWPKIPAKTFSALWVTPEFQQALEYRGVTLDENAGLSLEQQMALIKVTDPTDRRSLSAKLKELKIPSGRWQAWLRHPLFKQMYVQRTENAFTEAIQPTMMSIAGAAMNGDLQAGKLVLAITGRYRENDQAQQDAKEVIMAVLEAVIAHTPDPAVKSAILADIQAKVVGYDITHRQELNG